MEEILKIANTISPLGVIALLVMVIVYLVRPFSLKGKSLQFLDKQTTEGADPVTLMLLNQKLDKIANNHLHELPDMKKQLDRIEQKQITDGERLAGVETAVKFLQQK